MSLQSDLAHFTGTENWYKHWFGRGLYTNGVKYLADAAGAYWLIDAIMSWQILEEVWVQPFQTWTLKVEDKSGVLSCDDGDGNIIKVQEIDHTDFPMSEIKLWFVDGVLMLPSEY